MILFSGTGELRGAVGVKTAKLDVKQDQIGNPSECKFKWFLKTGSLVFRK